jgi:hypothetical protein
MYCRARRQNDQQPGHLAAAEQLRHQRARPTFGQKPSEDGGPPNGDGCSLANRR